MKPVFVAAYHPSPFGELMGMSVPEIVANAVSGTCRQIGVEARALDVASIGVTEVAMIGWCAWQLLGKAPLELQVKNARDAATFNIGGPICASVCTVLTPAS